MPDLPNQSTQQIKQQLLDGMASFMEADEDDEDFNCGYTKADVSRCEVIIDRYLAKLAAIAAGDEAAIKREVKHVVVQLNELNDRCDGALIETGQREDLCDLILDAAQGRGLTTEEDVTEEWREW